MPKKDFQKEMSNLMNQLKSNLQRLGKDAGVVAKKGEKELVKASSIGRLQIDIMGLNLQKEKLYYDMGKKTASVRSSTQGSDEVLKPYLQKLRKIEIDVRTKKREISRVKKAGSNSKKGKKSE